MVTFLCAKDVWLHLSYEWKVTLVSLCQLALQKPCDQCIQSLSVNRVETPAFQAGRFQPPPLVMVSQHIDLQSLLSIPGQNDPSSHIQYNKILRCGHRQTGIADRSCIVDTWTYRSFRRLSVADQATDF